MAQDARIEEGETLALVNTLNHAANQGVSLQEIIDSFCNQAGEAFAGNGATFYLLD